ncbi:ferredoxin [Chlamydiota bacterium]
MQGMRATIDEAICIGCELCVQACSDVFKMSDDKAVAYVDPVPNESEECCRSAVDACPVYAITLEE